MKLGRLTRKGRRHKDIDVVVAAYSAWRLESAEVRAAYRKWSRGSTSEAAVAFAAYRVALDREERAAEAYIQVLPRASRRPEFVVARQLAQLPEREGTGVTG